MVFYRKYRPQTISELDSPKLQEILRAVLSQKDVPHAFLFTGPKGLGKTSTARIIAKVLNCTHPNKKENYSSSEQSESRSLKGDSSRQARTITDIEPCNECEECISITNGTNIDVLEIDGASNRGIDEIRDLRERINLAPAHAAKKVYIIDEVHMLTTEAFNALLKTIEEPPSHVVFIFATTEPQKVPATIISRCFHISLNRATKDELIHALKRITNQEKIDITDDALALIAEMGDGGYRDATKVLEEVAALAGDKEITKEFIEHSYNTFGISVDITEFLDDLSSKNAVNALLKIKSITEQGMSVKYFVEQVLSRLHTILLSNLGIEKTQNILPELSPKEIAALVQLFSDAYQQTKYAVIPSLPLELAVVQYCQSSSVIASKAKQSDTNKEEIATSHVAPRNDKFTMKDALKKEQNLKVQQVLKGTSSSDTKKKETIDATQKDLPKDISDTAHLLENLIYKVKPYNHSVAGVLRGCVINRIDNDKIVFQTAYAFHKEKLEEPKIRDILEQVIKEVTGKKLMVMVELKK